MMQNHLENQQCYHPRRGLKRQTEQDNRSKAIIVDLADFIEALDEAEACGDVARIDRIRALIEPVVA
jgi:hypothetical protein